MTAPRDVVIVGGGIAGLTSAWKLRDVDAVVLESESRVGGRVLSEPRGDYWVNLGAHMFPTADSVVTDLLEEIGLDTVDLRGDLLKMAYRHKLILRGRPETYPFRLPLSLAGRIAMIRTGLRLKRDALAYAKQVPLRPGETLADARARLLAYRDDISFARYLGALPADVAELFRAVSNRMTAEPEEVAAGGAVALFAHVWGSDKAVSQARYLPGGAGRFPQRLGELLGNRVLTGATVKDMRRRDDGLVAVRYDHEGRLEELLARAAIVTTPAYVTAKIVADLSPELRSALERVAYGPFVVMGILTDQSRPMPWDDLYSVLVVGRSFNMFFNHANIVPGAGTPANPGGSLTIYGGADRARALLEKSDAEIERVMLNDLYDLFPQARGIVREVIIKRWPRVIPFNAPGRHEIQATLEAGMDNVLLAGDYMGEFVAMESAAQTATEAVARVRATLKRSAPSVDPSRALS